MIYRKFQDLELSALGMGAMRLPTIDGEDSRIDKAAAARMTAYAMEHGVNYYDTAWGYHGGNSELVMGEILEKYPREKFYLATKFPGYDLSNMSKVKESFEKQLEKCRVSYFDFYLFHNVCEMNINEYLDPRYGIYPYLLEQKKNGRIRHLGFSAHGSAEVIKRFLDAYGKDMEFCQLQINFLDWKFQEAEKKVALLKERNIPVWIMEPLRGGKLCRLDAQYESRLKAMRPEESIPGWSFRFIQSIPQAVVTLSGMSDLEQMKKNIATFETDEPLNAEEFAALQQIAAEMTEKKTVPCTACHYCVDHCPMGLDIPRLLSLYNEHAFTGGGFIAPMALAAIDSDKQPDSCIGCRSCEAVCPQQIKISETMADFTSKLGR